MKEVVMQGSNTEEATDQALAMMGANRDEVQVEPLQTGSKGFLGIGKRPAEVRVCLRPEERVRAKVFLRNILRFMDIDSEITANEEEGTLVVSLNENAGPLIGSRGQTLDSLQYLLARFINEDGEDHCKVIIDIDNYRDKRQDDLRTMAEQLAQEAAKSKKDQRTDLLSSAERRIIHMTLKEHPEVTTFSIGEGPRKRVVIASKDKNAERQSSGEGGGRSGGRRQGGGGGAKRSGPQNKGASSKGKSGSRGRRGGRRRGGSGGGGGNNNASGGGNRAQGQ